MSGFWLALWGRGFSLLHHGCERCVDLRRSLFFLGLACFFVAALLTLGHGGLAIVTRCCAGGVFDLSCPSLEAYIERIQNRSFGMSLAAGTSDAAKSQAWPKDDLRLLGNIKGLIASCHDAHAGYAQHLYIGQLRPFP